MAGLVDLGGGARMVDTGGMVNQAIGLAQLQQTAANAPMERKRLEIDTALKANELLNLDVTNLLKKAQLESAVSEEQRAKTKFNVEMMKTMAEIFRIDPSVGDAALRKMNPNASSTVNPDGTVTVEFPGSETVEVDGKMTQKPVRDKISFTLDPAKLDPEKKATLEGQWYDRFTKNDTMQNYRDISSQYRNLKSAAGRATGVGDVAVIFSYMKMLDPRSVVRGGEVAQAKDTANLPQSLVNLYNKALTSDAPIFGPKGSKTREEFVKTAEVFYGARRQDALMVGRDIAEFTRRERLSTKNVLSPVGDIKEEEFLMTDEDALKGFRSKLGGFGGQ